MGNLSRVMLFLLLSFVVIIFVLIFFLSPVSSNISGSSSTTNFLNPANCQVYKPNTATAQTDAAFKKTKGMVVHHVVNSTSIQDVGYYKAGTKGPGRDSSKYNVYNNVYQNDTQYWAKQGKDYKYMASYYYPGTLLVIGNGY
ncbi:hypothetical protein RAH41_22005 [Gottfriedia acidiceleris]|uniref:hypothetical protein n=1 Tax=Gottfriedia acidiceleris TaxID=371036 RepID=UPI002F26D361